MQQVTYEGKQGWLDESTNQFFPKESMEKVTYEGKKGLLHSGTNKFFSIEESDKRTTLQKVASTVSPYAPAALAVTGGIVGTPIVGGALGYLAGTEVEKRLQEYAGERQAPKGIGEAFKETGSQFIQKGTVPFTDIPSYRSPVAEAVGGGPLIGKAISTGVGVTGKVGKQLLGRLSGTGTGAVEEAVSSGEKFPLLSKNNPLASKTDFDKVMRGKISGEEVVQNAKDAIGLVRDNRGAEYLAKLNTIRTNPTALNKVKTNLDAELTKLSGPNDFQIGISTSPKGGIVVDFSKSPLVKNQGIVKKAVTDVVTWSDNSAAGLDTLKKRLSKYIDQTERDSPARAMLTRLEKNLNEGLKTSIPEYAEMTKGYAETTKIIKDIESGLMLRKEGMTGRIVADQTLKRLVSSMRDNFELRRDLVKVLSTQGGQDITGQAAGYAMRSPLPLGLAGTGPTLIGEAALAHYVSPKFWPVLAASSPRLQGEFLRLFGKGLAEVRGLSKPAGTAIAAGIAGKQQEIQNQKVLTYDPQTAAMTKP